MAARQTGARPADEVPEPQQTAKVTAAAISRPEGESFLRDVQLSTRVLQSYLCAPCQLLVAEEPSSGSGVV